jgi:CHAT domain-containing protein
MKYMAYNETLHADIIDNLITAYLHLNEPKQAKPYILEYYNRMVNRITNNFPTMSTQERYYFWRKNGKYLSYNIPRIASELNNSEMDSLAYDSQLMAKGLLLSAEIEFSKVIKDSKDDELIRLYDKFKENKNTLDKLYRIESSMRTIDIDSLQEIIEIQEKALIGKSKEYGDFAKSLLINWKDVQNNLNEDDIAIEFVAFVQRLDGPEKYYALTLKKNSSPQMIYLCDSTQIANVSSNNYYVTTDLYRLIWKPLEDELHNINKVYFSASGLLHTIGIEYLNIDDRKRMCDNYELYRLSSTRELVLKEERPQIKKAVLLGGLDYDASLNNTKIETGNNGQSGFNLKADQEVVDTNLFRGGAGYLEGTKYEVETIGGILEEEKINYKILSEAEGTEDSIKKLSGKKYNLLHIATHGFFLSSSHKGKNANTKNESNSTKEELALSRSGLLMSGANHFLHDINVPDNIEDGILTAKEISLLDFREMNMVVLSACQTGTGEVTSEGVYGLQRGFKKAGAKTIVMSLWKVNDEATLVLMSEFYNNLVNGQDKINSLKNAQHFLRSFDEGQYDDPKYWAAFIILDAI